MAESNAERLAETLSQVPIFSQMSTKALRRLALTAHTKHFAPGDLILNQGEPGIALYLLISGEADVIQDMAKGSPRSVAKLRNGDFFGEMALLDTYVRTASVKAVTACECITLTKWDFMAELRRSPDIAVQMLPVLGRRIRELEQRLPASADAPSTT